MERITLNPRDIMQRYGVSINIAYRIVREIRAFNKGGVIPVRGLVTLEEVRKWETRYDSQTTTQA